MKSAFSFLLMTFLATMLAGCNNMELQLPDQYLSSSITAVTSSDSGMKLRGDSIEIEVTFSNSVEVTGMPVLNVMTTQGMRPFTYAGGSGTKKLSFFYTLVNGDQDLNGPVATFPIDVSSGSIVKAGTRDAPNLSFLPTTISSVTLDAFPVEVSSIGYPANGTYGTGADIDLTLNLTYPVSVTAFPAIPLIINGVTRYAAYVSGSGTSALNFKYVVQNGEVDLDGLDINFPIAHSVGSAITTSQNRVLNLPSFAFSIFRPFVLVDSGSATVASVAEPTAGTYIVGGNLDFQVTFTHPIAVTGTPTLPLTVGSSTVQAAYLSGTGTNTLTFRYPVAQDEIDLNGVSTDFPINLGSGTLTTPGRLVSSGSTDTNYPGVLVDAARLTITSRSVPTDGTYTLGNQLDFTVNFSHTATVSNTPRLPLILGASTVYATYVSGSGTTALLFRYTVPVDQFDGDGISVDFPVDPNGGAITNGPRLTNYNFLDSSLAGVLVDSRDLTNSTIVGTSPVIANGVATSAVTITLTDGPGNPVSGKTPTFSATNTGGTNSYGACSVSSASGVSTCTLASSKAETKTLSLLTPVAKTGGTVVFTGGSAVAANSFIIGTGPVIANGVASSSVSITLNDIFNNPVVGFTPTFSATNTGTTNSYGTCSATDSSGVSTCTLASSRAETKTLSITSPVTKADGTVVFTAGAAVAGASTITGTGPVSADGVTTSTVTITLRDASSNPVPGQTPTFSATDTGATNAYGVCSVSSASGVSTCALTSTTSEVKTLSIATPVAKADGSVTFTAGAAVALNSTITGTSPIVANGSATSTVTITLRDASNNPVPGETPTFTATNTGTSNAYGACSVSNASGISTCTLTSLRAETKILSIATPVAKADGSVVFTSGSAVAANSLISGTGPVIANGSATSTVTITLNDVNNNPVSGQTPTFTATNTGTTNGYSACSVSNASGISTCTLASSAAETKILSIATPVVKADGTVVFTAGSAVAVNSSITGTSPVVADGSATSTVTITLRDAANNPVAGQTPTFGATNTGTTNSYGACSVSNASGVSTCTLSSTAAETKTLSISTPVVKADGTVVFTAGSAVAVNSSITGTGPVVADNVATSTVTITLRDAANSPVAGETPTFSATNTGAGNTYGACSVTNASGVSTCSLSSTTAEIKTLSIATPVVKADGTVVFTSAAAVAANSTITGSGPIVADSVATSTITITLRDVSNNPVVGQTPTFSATNTGSGNTQTVCPVTNASGVSTCTLKSTKAETKTLSIVTPVAKADGTVVFNPGSPAVANSDITGTTPVQANGVAVSFISITLADAFNNPVSGVTPIFNATDTGSTNDYGACSATNSSGASACTLSSITAEVKTLQMTSPIGDTGSATVTFTAGAVSATTSTIAGTGSVLANGVATSTVTITLRDAANNPVSGTTPLFSATDTGTTNIYTACSMSDAGGVATCYLSSTKAESKTLQITSPMTKSGGTVVFTPGTAAVATSTITGTGPVQANGVATSTITITLKDANSNELSGVTPTFSATNTGATNTYGLCSATNASGVSTCTLASTQNETKTLSISTPVSKADGTVVFFNSFTQTWPFSTGSNVDYTFDSTLIELFGGNARLVKADQLDDDIACSGFGDHLNPGCGGTFKGAIWDNMNSVLRLGNAGGCDGSTASCESFPLGADDEINSSWSPQYASLVSYWKLNGNYTDSRGSYNGSGIMSFVSESKLGSNAAAGTSAGVNASFGNVTELRNAAKATVSFWGRFTTFQDWNWFWEQKTADNLYNFGLGFNGIYAGNPCPSNQNLWISISNGFDRGGCTPNLFIQPNRWYHIVLVYDGTLTGDSNKAKLFVNGVQITDIMNITSNQPNTFTNDFPAQLSNIPDPFTITYPNTGNVMDDLAVWNAALTETEVKNIYARQSQKFSGSFTSRVMDAKAVQSWNSLAWNTTLPFNKPLPDAACAGATCAHMNSESSTAYPALVGSSGTTGDNDLMNGIVGLWHFNESAGTTGSNSIVDSSGKGNHGTPLMGVSMGGSGRFNTAAGFNGSDEIALTLANGLPITNQTQFSIQFWVKGFAQGDNKIFAENGNNTGNSGYLIGPAGTDKIRIFIRDDFGNATLLTTVKTVLDGTWHHFALVDNNGAVKVYVDGNLDQATFNYVRSTRSSLYSSVGNERNWPSSTFTGSIDELAVWNRLLSAGEVRQLYRRGANRLKLQVRTCSFSNCSDDASGANWKGPDGTRFTYFSELDNKDVSGNTKKDAPVLTLSGFTSPSPAARYFQYRTILESDDSGAACSYGSCSPEVRVVSIGPDHYDSSSPSIVTQIGSSYTGLSNFSETLGAGGCSSGVGYSLGVGASAAGATWYWWDQALNAGSGAWATSDGTVAKTNSSNVIQTNIGSFTPAYGPGTMFIKSHLKSSGTSPCELDELNLQGTR